MIQTAGWAEGHRLAWGQLTALAEASDGALQLISAQHIPARGQLQVDVSLGLDRPPTGPGIRVRARERFTFVIGEAFPFVHPAVRVPHRRWAGSPHVQWGQQLCLYAAPSTEWAPSEGMRGLLERLLLWLDRAAAATLDTDGAPLHPPVAYRTESAGTVVVRTDLADLTPWRSGQDAGPALVVALCTQHGDRLDVVRWLTAHDYATQSWDDGQIRDQDGQVLVAAATVLLTGDLGFEFPSTGADLLASLEQQDMARDDLLILMAVVARGNALSAEARGIPAPVDDDPWPHGPGGVPQVVLVGTPSRQVGSGPRAAHLVGWRLDDLTGQITDLYGSLLSKTWTGADALRAKVSNLGSNWLATAEVHWLRVFEDRPEVTLRRDSASSAEWLRNKRILILGCGALGAPVAEAAVRAGAADVTVVDNGVVTPGILVRQAYSDRDIGNPKATVLAPRLRQGRAGARVHARNTNAITLVRGLSAPIADSFDLIVDATADVGVRAAMERHRAAAPESCPPVITLLVGHQARRGIVTVSRSGASGGGSDILRRLGLAARTTHDRPLADIADDLYPATVRPDPFLPEPGCSAPTFIGSLIEATALAASLFGAGLDALAGRLTGPAAEPMAAAAIRLEHTDAGPAGQPGTTWLGWPSDVVLQTADGSFQVRVNQPAMGTIWAEARRGARLRGPGIETGGMLLGALDEATGVVHVDVATPPPPDSRCSAVHFLHGTEGNQETVKHYRTCSGDLTMFIGMWHTHPGGPAQPSPTDEAGMANLVTSIVGGPPRSLMLIVGGRDPAWSTWRDRPTRGCAHPPQIYARIVRRTDRHTAPPPQPDPPPGRYFVVGAPPTPPAHRPWWQWWSSAP